MSSAYASHVTSALSHLGAPAAVTAAARQSVVAGLGVAGHFPPALRAAAADATRLAFMNGLHAGSFVAAGATAAAALATLAFLPARAAAPAPEGGAESRPARPEPAAAALQ
jgi:MFS transporter, DHA2 family, multidrug resistance protein